MKRKDKDEFNLRMDSSNQIYEEAQIKIREMRDTIERESREQRDRELQRIVIKLTEDFEEKEARYLSEIKKLKEISSESKVHFTPKRDNRLYEELKAEVLSFSDSKRKKQRMRSLDTDNEMTSTPEEKEPELYDQNKVEASLIESEEKVQKNMGESSTQTESSPSILCESKCSQTEINVKDDSNELRETIQELSATSLKCINNLSAKTRYTVNKLLTRISHVESQRDLIKAAYLESRALLHMLTQDSSKPVYI